MAVALSGGKDSAATAHILHSLRHRLRISVVALHVNMGLGAFSHAAEQAAADLCDMLQIRLHVSHVDVYKRQLDSFDVIILELNLSDSVGLPTLERVYGRAPDIPIVVPVSYTHLDVYKRQSSCFHHSFALRP